MACLQRGISQYFVQLLMWTHPCISLSNASEEILLSRAKQIKQKVKQINLVLIFYLKLESAQWSRAVMGLLKTVWRVLCAASL